MSRMNGTSVEAADNNTVNPTNEYSVDTSLSHAVTFRTNLLALAPPNIRGSFIRQLTEDFIIPLKNLTLLVKIGEGKKLITLSGHC